MRINNALKVTSLALTALTLAVTVSTTALASPDIHAKLPISGCYIYGRLLAGKVQIVTTGLGRATDKVPTFSVQAVSAFQDLKVQTVNAFPTSCGKWQFVNAFPDFKVRFVNAFPDFTIKMVNAFPGR